MSLLPYFRVGIVSLALFDITHNKLHNMKTIRIIFLAVFIFAVILFFKSKPAGVILGTATIAYAGFSFFTHRVEKDQIAWILFGGRVIGTVGAGFHLIPAWICELEVFDKKFQIILHPGADSQKGQEYKCHMEPLALTIKPGDAEALEKVATFTPTIVLNVAIEEENMAALAASGGIGEAVGLVCETIVAGLQGIVNPFTLKEVIAQSIDIQRQLTALLTTELEGKGIEPDGNIKFTNMGIPKAIADSAEAVAAAENAANEERIKGKAAADVQKQKAEAKRVEMEEEARGRLALATAQAAGTKALVDALPGDAEQKVEVLTAQATGMQKLPEGLKVLVIGGNGDNASSNAATTASTIAAVTAAATEKPEKKPKDK